MKATKPIYPLTSLRFFAALCVVLHHTLDPIIPPGTRPAWFNRLQLYSGVTVLLFFILSGYVLAVVYLTPLRAESDAGGTVHRRRFWVARFARIYPLYLAALVLDAPNLLAGRIVHYGVGAALAKTAVSFVGSALLLQAWILKLQGIDYPNWSLSVEALFYLLFPLWAPRLWRLSLGAQITIAGLFFLAVFLWTYNITNLGREPYPYILPVHYLPDFLTGIVLARAQLSIERDPLRLARWRRAAIPMALFAVSVLILVCGAHWQGRWNWMPEFFFIPLFSLLLLAFGIGNRTIERVFSHRWLVLLGEASYALYLLHVIVAVWFYQYLHIAPTRVAYLLYLTIAVAVSIVSYKYFEVPARQWVLRSFHQRSRETEAAAAIAQ